MKRLLFFILLGFVYVEVNARNIQISGKVVDDQTGECLQFSTLSILNDKDSLVFVAINFLSSFVFIINFYYNCQSIDYERRSMSYVFINTFPHVSTDPRLPVAEIIYPNTIGSEDRDFSAKIKMTDKTWIC